MQRGSGKKQRTQRGGERQFNERPQRTQGDSDAVVIVEREQWANLVMVWEVGSRREVRGATNVSKTSLNWRGAGACV